MQRVKQCEGDFDGCTFCVGQVGPPVFRIRLDRRFVLRKREFEADVGVHVAVGNMMRNLADRPALWAIRRVELCFGESRNRVAKLGWCLSDILEEGAPCFVCRRALVLELPNRKAQIVHRSSLLADVRISAINTTSCTSVPATPTPPASNFDSPCRRFDASNMSSRLNSLCR